MKGPGTVAVTTGRSAVPDTLAVDMSAAPSSRPRSEGFIGEASMRTSTSSGPGAGKATSASDSSSSPLALMRERSCSPMTWLSAAKVFLPDLLSWPGLSRGRRGP